MGFADSMITSLKNNSRRGNKKTIFEDNSKVEDVGDFSELLDKKMTNKSKIRLRKLLLRDKIINRIKGIIYLVVISLIGYMLYNIL